MSDLPSDHPAFDAKRLIADLRRCDAQAIDEAYRRTFGSDMGRLVLAHFMQDCGVGSQFGVGVTDGELRYLVGQHNAAIALAKSAGFDQASIAAAVLSDELEGRTDDETALHQEDVVRFGGDWIAPDDVEF